jgi:hypothetical protein
LSREARSIAALNHSNVCHLYDVGPNYLVLEYVEGENLRGPMSWDEALPIVRQRIDGVEAAHEKNIIHSSVLHFLDERAVFSADILQVKRLPGGLAPTVGAWIDALTTITALDFEHALTGHALSGTKKDAMQSLQYLVDISKGVAVGIAAGRSLPEIQKSLTLDAYKGFERWDTIREAHIAAVYATIAGSRPAASTGTR